MTEIEGLRERVAKATGPDREIDTNLASALVWPFKTGSGREIYGYPCLLNLWLQPNGEWAESVPAFTASIDAALALVERKLPDGSKGWFCDITINDFTNEVEPYAALRRVEGDEAVVWSGGGSTLPLAILSALLAALSQEEPGRT